MTEIRSLRIALAQLNQSVGDLAANASAMLEWRANAAAQGADLIIFPELQLIGYPPEDLVLKPALVERAELELIRLAEATGDGGPAMLVGTVFEAGGLLFNCVALLDEGTIVAVSQKRELPNYGVFDEKRLFAPGPLPGPLPFRGVQLGLPIGEDISFPFVSAHLKAAGADLLIAVTASPFEAGKDSRRRNGLCAARVRETGLPILYVNRVGGQDELVFDGASFVMDGDGAIPCRLPEWEEALVVTEWQPDETGRWHCLPALTVEPEECPADIYAAMLVALRDHVARNRFPAVLIGLAGDIDSALTAAVAVDALGPERVRCVAMPSTDADTGDLAECATMLGVRLDTVPMGGVIAAFDGTLGEHLLPRIRAATLLALADESGALLLATCTKSDLGIGDTARHTAMAGGYAVLKDAYGTTVRDLARWRNAHRPSFALGPDGPVIAARLLDTPAAAFDPILQALVEQDKSVDEVVTLGFDRATVARIEGLLHAAEAKRRPAPSGVKLTDRAFGRDRRYPISNAFRTA